MSHSHSPVSSLTGPFMGGGSDRVAQGGVTITEACLCGHIRRTNQNAGRSDAGPWHAVTPASRIDLARQATRSAAPSDVSAALREEMAAYYAR